MPYVPPTQKSINAEFETIKTDLEKIGKTDEQAIIFLKNQIAPQYQNLKTAQKIEPSHKKKFFLGNIEIGECYHMGAALCLADMTAYQIVQEMPANGPAAYYAVQKTYLKGLALVPDIEITDAAPAQQKGGSSFLADSNIFHQTMLCKEVLHNPIEVHKKIFERILASLPDGALDQIRDILDNNIKLNKTGTKIMLWVRNKGRENPGEQYRDMGTQLIQQLIGPFKAAGISEVVLLGDAVDTTGLGMPPGIKLSNMMEYFKSDWFAPMKAENSLAYQALIPWVIFREYGGIGMLGMKSGAMDGPSFAGVPQIFIDRLTVDPQKFNAPYVKYTERMGLVALCDPFWNQLAVLRKDTEDLVFTDSELAELNDHLRTLGDIRTWYLKDWKA